MKTLLYPDAGWDNSILEIAKKKNYKMLILYDSMPRGCRYHNGEPSIKYCKSNSAYLKKLSTVFGTFSSISGSCIYFPKHNIYYHYNHDMSKFPKSFDLYINTFLDKRLMLKYRHNRIVTSCNTLVDGVDGGYKSVCVCDKGECIWD